MIWAKILIFFGHKYDESVIPRNIPYCYTPDDEKNKDKYTGVYYVKPCPYGKTLGKDWIGCKFLGVIANWDLLLSDQCKICGISDGIDKFEEESNK
jgi:hypothetical protein